MKCEAMDLGMCGVEQVLCAGAVRFDTKDADKGIVLAELPENIIITKAVAVVNKAFNAATTNVITVGTNDAANDLLGSSDVTAGTANSYAKNVFKVFKGKKTAIKVKFSQTGAKATTGEADIYLNVVRIPGD